MKKITSVMFAFLAFSVLSNAAITVEKGGKIETINDNAVVSTDGLEATTINYNGLKITVPQGVKLSVSEVDGKIVINGDNFSGVKVSNLTFNSNGNTAISVNTANNTIKVNNGENVTITNVNGVTSSIKAGQSAIMVAFAKPEAKEEPKAEVTNEADAKAKAEADKKAKKEADKLAKEQAKAEKKAQKEAEKQAKAEAKAAAKAEAAETAPASTTTEANVPSFVIPATESAAKQQAVQNVEETISASAPF